MLFNEPKLLKLNFPCQGGNAVVSFSALQRAEIAEIKSLHQQCCRRGRVSVLFNEPKLLKLPTRTENGARVDRFSALQRAEIAEIPVTRTRARTPVGFSALQRAEIAEILKSR